MTGLAPEDHELLRAYKLAFGNAAGEAVLQDLAAFCRAAETCVVTHPGTPVDLNRTLINEGRREVWLRITEFLHLAPEQILALRMQRRIGMKTEDGDVDTA